MRVLQEGIIVVLGSLQECELRKLLVKTRELVECRCMLLLMAYWCGILIAKDIQALQHGVVVKKHCVGCMVSEEDIVRDKMDGVRFVRKTMMIRSRFPELSKNNTRSVLDLNEADYDVEADWVQELSRKFEISVTIFFEMFIESRRVRRMSHYLVLIFKSLHSIHFRTAKMGKGCTVKHF